MTTYYPYTLRAGERLRLRFASLRRDPLFAPLIRQYENAWERDDDFACREIEAALLGSLVQRGAQLPSGTCSACGYPKPEVLRDYEEECDSCKKYHADQMRRRAAADERRARMTPEETAAEAKTIMLCIHGMISRDVQ